MDSGGSDGETAPSVAESEVILRTQMPDIPTEEIVGLVQHPHFQDYVDQIVTTQVHLALSEAGTSNKDKTGDSPAMAVKEGQGKSSQLQPRNIKSPSDTTIYALALNFTPDKQGTGVLGNQAPNANDQRISQFLDNMRFQVQSDNGHDVIAANPDSEPLGPACMGQAPGPSAETNNYLNWKDQAREVAGQLVLDVEQSQTCLEVPQGNQVYSDFMDDKFFHITCHMDQATKTKIEQGQFIELDKLLIKDRPFARGVSDSCMAMFSKDGLTYFAPVSEKDHKITNVRCWEQAFRVYAAIYSKANPQRSAEIWQYVYVINSAAATYVWDNVAEYDYMFRQLMATYPTRSWAKTYLQGWNLSMLDHLSKSAGILRKDSRNP